MITVGPLDVIIPRASRKPSTVHFLDSLDDPGADWEGTNWEDEYWADDGSYPDWTDFDWTDPDLYP